MKPSSVWQSARAHWRRAKAVWAKAQLWLRGPEVTWDGVRYLIREYGTFGEPTGYHPSIESAIRDPTIHWDRVMRWWVVRFGRRRWPEGEAAIAQNPVAACFYAREVIRGRWSEGEATISREPWMAYLYAQDVIRGQWPEGESAIVRERETFSLYLRLTNGRMRLLGLR